MFGNYTICLCKHMIHLYDLSVCLGLHDRLTYIYACFVRTGFIDTADHETFRITADHYRVFLL